MEFEKVFGVRFFEVTFIVSLCLLPYVLVTSSVLLYLLVLGAMYMCLRVVRKNRTKKISVTGQGVVITGCDSAGFTVFAGCLSSTGDGAKKLKKNSSRRLHIVAMDVSQDETVAKAHEYILANLPPQGLWGIVNNAGFNVMGDVEWCTVKLFQKVMNVNFYGALRTLRTFLHMVRKTKGRIVVVTSVKGLGPWPADSAYHVTKHSLETLADSLRLEMVKFGVKVAVVEPGNFAMATSCQNETVFQRYSDEIEEMWSSGTDEMRKTYGRQYVDDWLKAQRSCVENKAAHIMTTAPVIDALEDALVSEIPNTRYLVTGTAGWIDSLAEMGRFHHFLPTWLTDYIITKMTGCDKFPEDVNKKGK